MGMLYELDDIDLKALGLRSPANADIQMAQVEAGERAVVERLRAKGLLQEDVTPASEDEWRYEFRSDEKYPDLGTYTILAPNPDAGKEGVAYSGAELAIAETEDKEAAITIVRDHNSHRKLVDALRPFAEAARLWDATYTDGGYADNDAANNVRVGDLRHARFTLTPDPKGEEGQQ